MRSRHQMNQVSVSFQIPRQKQEMVIRIPSSGSRFLFKTVPGRDVHLATHDRLHPRLLRRLVKLDRPIQVPVIRQSQRRLPQLLGPRRQLGHAARPVQQGIFRMTVEMDERLGHRESICFLPRLLPEKSSAFPHSKEKKTGKILASPPPDFPIRFLTHG